MATQYIYDLTQKRLPASVGNKAKNLRRLAAKQFKIPVTYVCTWDAYERYLQADCTVLDVVADQLVEFIRPGMVYAVRSSANIEDSFEHSFAGQFKSLLDLHEITAVLEAMRAIWEQTLSPGVGIYLQRVVADHKDLKMAVIIQEMVSPHISGVAFSRNPLTGLNEIVVEAVHGRGDTLVQAGVTPQRWVYTETEWVYQPQVEDISRDLLQVVVEQTAAIRKAFRQEVDLEWVYDGSELYWVQMREITSLGEQAVYSNKIAKDMLPGIIKPLVWSVNTPIINTTWVELIEEAVGDSGIDPASLTKAFYYRTYFNMAAFGRIFKRLGMPGDSLEAMMGISRETAKKRRFRFTPGMLRFLPKVTRFVVGKWRFSSQIDNSLPDIENRYREIALERNKVLDEQRLLVIIDQLKNLTRRTAYLNIVGPLLMFMYNGMLRRQLKKIGLEYENLDLMRGVEELTRYDPGYHLDCLSKRFNQLSPALQDQIRRSDYVQFQQLEGIEDLQAGVATFLEQFGHLSDSGNDFSCVPWRENPDLILQMILNYTKNAESTSEKLVVDKLPVVGMRRWRLKRLSKKARQYRLYREQISSVYTFGYGLFRDFYLALGDKLVQRGILEEREDIFYLYEPEVRSVIDSQDGFLDCAALVRRRKEEVEQYRDIALPELIFGDQPPPLIVAASQILQGTPTSRGYFTGPVINVSGISDIHKVKAGDVVVIPYSDVGWTPLFAQAGAVIAAAGGILSHCSIVAREYNIPAVVSVTGVTRLRDNMLVTVDGYRGEILLHEDSLGTN